MVALFKSHFSIGRSILTLDDPKKSSEGGPDSILKIALDDNLKKIVLVEDNMTGFFEAYKRCKEFNLELVFGLRMSMRNSALEHDISSEHKIVVFAKNSDGCKLLNKIYSKAFCEFGGFLDYEALKSFWSEDSLILAVPFYDSFIHVNSLGFGNAIPDFSFTDPIFFIESNNLAIDHLIENKVLDFLKERVKQGKRKRYDIVKSIYYKEKKDASALMTYKIICNRSFGKNRTLDKPELPHFCSNEFCFESWREQSHVNR